jgi:C_GCAxxG_C_C family probable redox protein
MNRVERVIENFNKGLNSSQSILLAFSDIVKVDEKVLLRMATPFGAGIGRLQYTCGAVTGALMIIGFVHGQSETDDEESKEKSYTLARKFDKEFREKLNTTTCKELVNCDLMSVEGREYYTNNNLKENVCYKSLEISVEILEKMI